MKPDTPMQKRARDAAETAWEASGVRHLTSQIDGLAHLFVAFAENELRIAERVARHASPLRGIRERRTR